MMKDCTECCKSLKVACPNAECRYHMEYEEDLNCSLISIEKNGKMTLRQVGDRLGVSFVRIKQIEQQTTSKLVKRLSKVDIKTEIFEESPDYL